MKELRTEIEILAPPERVWAILADTDKYPEWNPLITRVSGQLVPRARPKVTIKLPSGMGMKIRPEILAFERPREIRWRGHLFVPGIFTGEHSFVIETISPGRCRFLQNERFTGILIPLFGKMIDGDTRAGFEAMNRALKARAEH
jgi:hypothetical protein